MHRPSIVYQQLKHCSRRRLTAQFQSVAQIDPTLGVCQRYAQVRKFPWKTPRLSSKPPIGLSSSIFKRANFANPASKSNSKSNPFRFLSLELQKARRGCHARRAAREVSGMPRPSSTLSTVSGTAVNKIREALGDRRKIRASSRPCSRRGYRFIAQVNGLQRDARSPAATGESDLLEASKPPFSAWQLLAARGCRYCRCFCNRSVCLGNLDAVGPELASRILRFVPLPYSLSRTFRTTPNRNFLPME